MTLFDRQKSAKSGRVVRTAGALDRRSRTLRTEAHVPNEDHALLAPEAGQGH